MALRLYPLCSGSTSGAAVGVTIYRGGWIIGGTPALFLMSVDKSDEATNGYQVKTTGVGSPGTIDDTAPANTFIYPLPADTTLSGTIQLCLPCLGDNRYVENIGIHAYVTVGTTGGLRGTLLNQYLEPAGTNEIPDTVTAVALDSPQTINTVAASAGDYIIIEVGFAFRGPAPNNGNVNSYHGCRSSGGVVVADLVEGDPVNTVTNSGAAWFEFVGVPIPPPPLVGTVPSCCDPTPVAPDPTGALPAWVPMCEGGGEVDTVMNLGDGEYWG